jgi:hypothetical protein
MRPQNISKYDDLKLEDKTTGKIYFRNCNQYIQEQHYEVGHRIDKYKQQEELCGEVSEYDEDE